MDTPLKFSTNDVGKRMVGVLSAIPAHLSKHDAALYVMERCATSPPPKEDVVQVLQVVLQCTAEQAEYFYGAVHTRTIADSD